MLYYYHCYKNILFPFYYAKNLINDKPIYNLAEYLRYMYDKDTKGNAAPIVDRYSVSECYGLFKNFSQVTIDKEINNYKLRTSILGEMMRPIGHDLYISGKKS